MNKEISQIKTFLSWNGYPERVSNFVIERLETNTPHPRITDDDRMKIWLNLCNGKLGEKLVTSLIKKLKRYFKENFNIVVKYRTNKLSIFCPTKDRISWNQKANVIYIVQCPNYHNDYVGKTDKNLKVSKELQLFKWLIVFQSFKGLMWSVFLLSHLLHRLSLWILYLIK